MTCRVADASHCLLTGHHPTPLLHWTHTGVTGEGEEEEDFEAEEEGAESADDSRDSDYAGGSRKKAKAKQAGGGSRRAGRTSLAKPRAGRAAGASRVAAAAAPKKVGADSSGALQPTPAVAAGVGMPWQCASKPWTGSRTHCTTHEQREQGRQLLCC